MTDSGLDDKEHNDRETFDQDKRTTVEINGNGIRVATSQPEVTVDAEIRND